MQVDVDIAIIGAGPVGLCFAAALADSGLRIVVIDRQAEAELSMPVFDGREIALTHFSAQYLRKLGLWQHINTQAISPLRNARVFNGTSLVSFNINHRDTSQDELGYLVSNHNIRKAAYDVVKSLPSVTLKTGLQVASIQTHADCVKVVLANDDLINTKLLIGADSRFSETRRAMGIAADMHDFGKTMIVCTMKHSVSHEQTAWEWFDYGQTLALLPMNGQQSSVVITLPPKEIDGLMKMHEDDFNREVSARFKHRLGAMQLVSTRHAYPLVTVYSKRFISSRFALIGDAAVGMHPVTAHGFNFGLKGSAALSSEIKAAIASGKDIASNNRLLRYEQAHRRETRPLFLATHAIAKVYGNDTPPFRLLRTGALHMGSRMVPFKRAVARFLADSTGS